MTILDNRIILKHQLQFAKGPFDSKSDSKTRYLDLVEAYEIVYFSSGLKVKGYYVKPKSEGPFPCIIFNRGGNREFAAITEQVVADILCRFSSWGYVVYASQYRGTYGGEGKDEFGGRDIDDVMSLFDLIDQDEFCDASSIGMYGGSRGGMMTYLALTITSRVRAAVIRSGVSDLTKWTDDRQDMEEVYRDLIPGFSRESQEPLIHRSALYWADKLCKTTPILILQGSADWRVNPLSALLLAQKLLENRHPFRMIMYEGADHALTECRDEMFQQTKVWFDKFVKNREPLPDMLPHGE